ncbi:MAG: hypothetical protein HQK52_04705 [Oligoflexia bacterium]|nr:hypothetical protein [Oligoflexia bacterium]
MSNHLSAWPIKKLKLFLSLGCSLSLFYCSIVHAGKEQTDQQTQMEDDALIIKIVKIAEEHRRSPNSEDDCRATNFISNEGISWFQVAKDNLVNGLTRLTSTSDELQTAFYRREGTNRQDLERKLAEEGIKVNIHVVKDQGTVTSFEPNSDKSDEKKNELKKIHLTLTFSRVSTKNSPYSMNIIYDSRKPDKIEIRENAQFNLNESLKKFGENVPVPDTDPEHFIFAGDFKKHLTYEIDLNTKERSNPQFFIGRKKEVDIDIADVAVAALCVWAKGGVASNKELAKEIFTKLTEKSLAQGQIELLADRCQDLTNVDYTLRWLENPPSIGTVKEVSIQQNAPEKRPQITTQYYLHGAPEKEIVFEVTQETRPYRPGEIISKGEQFAHLEHPYLTGANDADEIRNQRLNPQEVKSAAQQLGRNLAESVLRVSEMIPEGAEDYQNPSEEVGYLWSMSEKFSHWVRNSWNNLQAVSSKDGIQQVNSPSLDIPDSSYDSSSSVAPIASSTEQSLSTTPPQTPPSSPKESKTKKQTPSTANARSPSWKYTDKLEKSINDFNMDYAL